MTPTDIAADRQFIQSQLEGLAPQIRQHTILLRAYTAGGEAVKDMKDKVAAVLGGQIAMRESLEADLAALIRRKGNELEVVTIEGEPVAAEASEDEGDEIEVEMDTEAFDRVLKGGPR